MKWVVLLEIGWHYFSWRYEYLIENRKLYISPYTLSWHNIFADHDYLEIKIPTGYKEFDEVYLRGSDEDLKIWDIEHGIIKSDRVMGVF